MARRLNVTLDDERAAKLARLAERMHVQEGTLARSLLATALDEADPDPRSIAALLDAIPAPTNAHGSAPSRRAAGRPSRSASSSAWLASS